MWHDGIDKNTHRHNYWHHQRGVYIRYYPDTNSLTIDGKILSLLSKSQVLNVDDLYGADLDAFVSDINDYLHSLFYPNLLNIRSFYVMRIDYCFNVKTPFVPEYLDFMAAAFKAVDRGRRVNYTEEHNLDGSVYIKTKSDYDNNTRRNYVMNFYNKADWLENKLVDGWHFCFEDIDDAQNILRLEAQCGGGVIKRLLKKHGLRRTFGDMFSFQLAYEAIEHVYRLVFHAGAGQDYYAYSEAKKLVPRGAAATALKKLAQNNKTEITTYSADLIRNAGVYPFHFIDKRSEIKTLENPLKLIRRKMAVLGIPEHDESVASPKVKQLN